MSQSVRPWSVRAVYLNRVTHVDRFFQASPPKPKPAEPTPPAIDIASLDFANLRPVPKHEREFDHAAAAVERVHSFCNRLTHATQRSLHPADTLAHWLD